MPIHVVPGNLLIAKTDYICHQVNCQGFMNSGVAKQIRNKWPQVYQEYLKKFEDTNDEISRLYGRLEYAPSVSEIILGQIQMVKVDSNLTIVNMFAQQDYGYDGKRYTSYDAFWNCLNLMKQTIPKGKAIAFPYKIGSDRGGANWNIIYSMIREVFEQDYEVYIYRLEE